MIGAKSLEAIPFVDGGIIYGEGPRWHGDRLWFTDGPAGKVCSVDEAGDITIEAELDHPSGLGWLAGGRLVVSALLEAKVHHLDRQGNLENTHDLGDLAWSTNDIVVTSDGRSYVDLYQVTDSGMTGAIALIDIDGATRLVATGLDIPNGLGILPDRSTLVVSETNGSRLLSFPINDDGSLGAASVFADLGAQRHPDGLCIDEEGAVWVGCYDTSEFIRVAAGGTVTHCVSIAQGWAVAPALGGGDGRTLYMVINETTHQGLVAGQSTGRIMQARVDVAGLGSP